MSNKNGDFEITTNTYIFAGVGGVLLGGLAAAALGGMQNIIAAGVVGVGTGAAGNSVGSIRGKYQSSDGTAGVATFGPGAVASITVKDGIITAIS